MAALVALQQGDIAAGEARMSDAEAEFIASVGQNWQLTAVADGIRTAGARWPLEWGLWIQALLCEARGDTGQARALLEDAWELAAPCVSACPTASWGPIWPAWRLRRATVSERQQWLTR